MWEPHPVPHPVPPRQTACRCEATPWRTRARRWLVIDARNRGEEGASFPRPACRVLSYFAACVGVPGPAAVTSSPVGLRRQMSKLPAWFDEK
jgi:hypothetical protein